jgi:hypothetical protein
MLAMIERMLSARPVPALNVDPSLELMMTYSQASIPETDSPVGLPTLETLK